MSVVEVEPVFKEGIFYVFYYRFLDLANGGAGIVAH
jgi:hypothetical protein